MCEQELKTMKIKSGFLNDFNVVTKNSGISNLFKTGMEKRPGNLFLVTRTKVRIVIGQGSRKAFSRPAQIGDNILFLYLNGIKYYIINC